MSGRDAVLARFRADRAKGIVIKGSAQSEKGSISVDSPSVAEEPAPVRVAGPRTSDQMPESKSEIPFCGDDRGRSSAEPFDVPEQPLQQALGIGASVPEVGSLNQTISLDPLLVPVSPLKSASVTAALPSPPQSSSPQRLETPSSHGHISGPFSNNMEPVLFPTSPPHVPPALQSVTISDAPSLPNPSSPASDSTGVHVSADRRLNRVPPVSGFAVSDFPPSPSPGQASSGSGDDIQRLESAADLSTDGIQVSSGPGMSSHPVLVLTSTPAVPTVSQTRMESADDAPEPSASELAAPLSPNPDPRHSHHSHHDDDVPSLSPSSTAAASLRILAAAARAAPPPDVTHERTPSLAEWARAAVAAWDRVDVNDRDDGDDPFEHSPHRIRPEGTTTTRKGDPRDIPDPFMVPSPPLLLENPTTGRNGRVLRESVRPVLVKDRALRGTSSRRVSFADRFEEKAPISARYEKQELTTHLEEEDDYDVRGVARNESPPSEEHPLQLPHEAPATTQWTSAPVVSPRPQLSEFAADRSEGDFGQSSAEVTGPLGSSGTDISQAERRATMESSELETDVGGDGRSGHYTEDPENDLSHRSVDREGASLLPAHRAAESTAAVVPTEEQQIPGEVVPADEKGARPAVWARSGTSSNSPPLLETGAAFTTSSITSAPFLRERDVDKNPSTFGITHPTLPLSSTAFLLERSQTRYRAPSPPRLLRSEHNPSHQIRNSATPPFSCDVDSRWMVSDSGSPFALSGPPSADADGPRRTLGFPAPKASDLGASHGPPLLPHARTSASARSVLLPHTERRRSESVQRSLSVGGAGVGPAGRGGSALDMSPPRSYGTHGYHDEGANERALHLRYDAPSTLNRRSGSTPSPAQRSRPESVARGGMCSRADFPDNLDDSPSRSEPFGTDRSSDGAYGTLLGDGTGRVMAPGAPSRRGACSRQSDCRVPSPGHVRISDGDRESRNGPAARPRGGDSDFLPIAPPNVAFRDRFQPAARVGNMGMSSSVPGPIIGMGPADQTFHVGDSFGRRSRTGGTFRAVGGAWEHHTPPKREDVHENVDRRSASSAGHAALRLSADGTVSGSTPAIFSKVPADVVERIIAGGTSGETWHVRARDRSRRRNVIDEPQVPESNVRDSVDGLVADTDALCALARSYSNVFHDLDAEIAARRHRSTGRGTTYAPEASSAVKPSGLTSLHAGRGFSPPRPLSGGSTAPLRSLPGPGDTFTSIHRFSGTNVPVRSLFSSRSRPTVSEPASGTAVAAAMALFEEASDAAASRAVRSSLPLSVDHNMAGGIGPFGRRLRLNGRN